MNEWNKTDVKQTFKYWTGFPYGDDPGACELAERCLEEEQWKPQNSQHEDERKEEGTCK